MAVNNLAFVLVELALDHFLNQVDRNIHVVADLLRADNAALDRNRDLNLLSFLLNGKCYVHFCIRRKIAFKLPKLILNRLSQVVGDFDILSIDHKVHTGHLTSVLFTKNSIDFH